MRDDGVEALRRALESPVGDHLDDDVLAALATAEAAGEDVETLYPEPVAHLETCVRCAQAYGDLVEMMLEAVDEMAATAQRTSPQAAYAALLARRLSEEGAEGVQGLAEGAAAGLPALFAEPPAGPEEVTPLLVATALAASEGDGVEVEHDLENEAALAVVQRVTEAVRERFSALPLYLLGAAEAAWQRAPAVRMEMGGRREEAALRRGPAPALLREATAEYGAPEEAGRLPVTLRAVRLSTLACRVEVQVETMGEGPEAGITVRACLPGGEETATTDDRGVATFAPVPIAALPHLLVKVGEG
ncbi:MAG: hypothetical protein R3248_01515 [Candidatus Promineifilaceae bacterium]|nr:hypothetical protein [Candidatus Promineifilaceae bacterium]